MVSPVSSLSLSLSLIATIGSPASAQFSVLVTPKGAAEPARNQHTTGFVSQLFTVKNTSTSSGNQAYALSCSSAGNVTCTGTSKTTVTLAKGASTTLTATYSTTNTGTGTVYVKADNGLGVVDSGYVTVPVVVPAGAPRVVFSPMVESNTDYGRCAASCFAALYAQSTVPYFSLDTPRNVTLVYNGDRVNQKPFVNLDVAPGSGFGSFPTEYQLQVKIDGALVTFLGANETTLRFAYQGLPTTRIGGQFDASGLAHGTVHAMEIIVTTRIGANTYTNRLVTQYLAVNLATAAVARGWLIGGVQRAFPQANGSLFVLESDGSALYFKNLAPGVFASPEGDFSRVTGVGGWTRTYADSTRVVFDVNGYMTSITDRWGNVTAVTYDASNRVSQIKDPLLNAITLTYNANGLATIAEPSLGAPVRSTIVTVNAAKNLTGIADPDGVATTFGYDASNRLRTVTDRAGKQTSLAYDAQSGTVASDTAPQIPVCGATCASTTLSRPVTTLASWQKRGVPYSATAVVPFTPPRSDTAWAVITEPGGAVTRFTSNRAGHPLRTIAPLNDTTVVRYTAMWQPARVVRPGYSTADFDTVAYQASGLPTYTRRAGLSGTNITYGGWGQPTNSSGTAQPTVVHTIGANDRLTQTSVGGVITTKIPTYDAYGRPTKVTDGGDTLVAQYAYVASGSTRNLQSVTRSGTRVTTYGYDGYGRMVYRAPPGGLAAESTYYSVINRVDSVVQKSGASRWVTKYGHDNLYVTSVTDPKGQVYGYLYNALGWLVRQTDPTGARTRCCIPWMASCASAATVAARPST